MRTAVSQSLPLRTILENDEKALRAGEPCVLVARSDQRAFSLGVSQALDVHEAARAREMGIDVVKRSSGGVGLLHEKGDLFWSIVLPRDHPMVGKDFVNAYPRFGAGLVHFFKEAGIDSVWVREPERFSTYCLFSGRGHILSVGGGALGGASQHLSGKSILHHGSISNTVNVEAIAKIFGMPEKIARSHLRSLSGLGVHLSPQDLMRLADCIGGPLEPEQ